ncbi:MAG: 1-deoxy-D-xylulose-5-phosphate reductoisomerase [Deltaproteobacteria bacterium]|nr:MAG: 1-deoxy-D-xylulose-5-phosphate reductoisomerase [Deltaproteobacteria bacterium]
MTRVGKKNIAILGSTGSIGVNTLRIVGLHPEKYGVLALGAGRNVAVLLRQINQWHPRAVAVQDNETAALLRKRLSGKNPPEILVGTKGYVELATMDGVDTVVSAISGAAGLIPTYEAVKAGKRIALANKETMVMAGQLIMSEATKRNTDVLPIDSEHSAILQCLRGHAREDIKKIILTASGGPFLDMRRGEMKDVTPEQALKHPNWKMGPKVSIDSATLMNKGLEAIEAMWFFGLPMENIDIVIHPQSIVHSMVEYKDGSVIAQLGVPDMAIPISYALAYPRHMELDAGSLDLCGIGNLSFKAVDTKKFPCLALALKAARVGGTMPTVLNAANEVAVEAFLGHEIAFLKIPNLIEQIMELHEPMEVKQIEQVMKTDSWAREKARELIEKSTNGGPRGVVV